MGRKLIRRPVGKVTGADLSPLLNRLFFGRGVTDSAELDHTLAGLAPPAAMAGLAEAAALLESCVTGSRRVLVVGDFDADGATSVALCVSVLRAMGAPHVDYLVPNRFEFGYGLTPEIVDVAQGFSPDLIVTVDNGISSHDGINRANKLGIQVLVTDHHLPGASLPAAAAIVNPNQPGCQFPSKALAGVGVAFYLLSAVRAGLRAAGWFKSRPEPRLADYLDLVALGTIADVVPLDRNNRILVGEGLRRIRAGRGRPGINALIAVAGADIGNVTSRDLAFGIGPRLNAAGRLLDMTLGIECLLSVGKRAVELAGRLDEINQERREIERDMKDQAEIAMNTEVRDDVVGVCLHHPDWHEGVVGIVASRIKDQVHRPVIAFARTASGDLKGSARSVPGLHIRDALDAVATRHPGLLRKFGGHAMAAGLTLAADDLARFSEAFDLEARRWLDDDALENRLISDGEIDTDIDLALARSLIEAAPWGQGFPEPVFDGWFEVIDQRLVAGRHLKLKLRPEQGRSVLEAIAFNHPYLLEQRRAHLAYRLDVNRYRGLDSVQLIVECTDLV